MSALSDWLKTRRKELGFTQVRLAERLGVHQAIVSTLENGKPPDAILMEKIESIYGKFAGSYIPAQSSTPGTKKIMSAKAKDGLKAYREAKENNFCLQIDDMCITADRNQYILKQGANASYFVELKALLKYLIASKARQSAVNSVQEICKKLEEIYKRIEEKFNNYDPAGIEEASSIDEEKYIKETE